MSRQTKSGRAATCAFQPGEIWPDNPDAFIFMAGRCSPQNAIDGRYVWRPIKFHHGVPTISWQDEWNPGVFD